MKAFEELVVVELAGSPAGAYAAKLFADYGAQVVKLEPPGGDPARREGEDWGGVGTLFAHLNTGKRSHALDLEGDRGRSELESWARGADVLIESSAPDPLLPRSAAIAAPQLIRVWISPFGSTGPYASYRSNEFTDDALGGHLFLNGEPDREPIARPGLHAQYQAGAHGFIGALGALRVRDTSGEGQTVEISHLEGLASLHQHSITMWTHAGHVLRRDGNAQPGFWHPAGVYPCKDGWVHLGLVSSAKLEPFFAAAGIPELLLDRRFADDLLRGQHKREFDDALRPWLMQHSADEIVSLGQGVATPVGPVPELLEVLEDPHLAARGFFRELAGSPPLRFPGGPFRIDHRSCELRRPPALGKLDGPPPESEPPQQPTRRVHANGPLEGIRVLDLTRVWAGPLAGRILGDLGADVILVEAPWGRGAGRELPPRVAELTHLFPENEVGDRPWNRNGGFNKLARNKRSVTLSLSDPEGKRLFEELVRHADVVLENYSPRVMPKLGLSFERLCELNPELVYVALSGFGRSGPHRDWVAFGPLIEAATGLSSAMGYADSGPYRSGIAWPDPVSSLHAVAGTLLALRDRDLDPERRARKVEVSMLEAMLPLIGEALLDAQLRGESPRRRGNRHPHRAPQGCYPCAGEDRWIAISVDSQLAWSALGELAGLESDWRELSRLERLARHEEIDARLAAFTRTRDRDRLMALLQGAGVIAGAVHDARDLVENEQLTEREFWVELEHRDAGEHRTPGLAIRFEKTPVRYRRPAPCLGEHNAEVLRELLGLAEIEIERLRRTGVLVDSPPLVERAPRRNAR